MLAADAKPLALNAALQAWIDEGPALTSWLPPNCAALVRACLRQHRAIADVEVQVGERTVLWSFIPDDQGQQVLGRCRDASEERRGAREGQPRPAPVPADH